jgi:hypothetical protein
LARARPALAGLLTLAALCGLSAGGAEARAGGATQAVHGAGAVAPGAGKWSGEETLSACASVGAAHAAFPRDKPTHATGAGAIVWSDSSACPGGAGTIVAAIGRKDAPSRPSAARAPDGAKLSLRPPLALAPAPHGQLAIAGSSPDLTNAGRLVQGSAAGPFSALGTISGAASQNALATGYLGDVAAASPTGGASGRAGVRVAVERYFARTLSPSLVVPARAGAVRALTVGLDYRTDAIAAWSQGSSLYAHDLPASGSPQPTQRLADVDPAAHITVLISDDNRAIVAWADERAGSTSVYLDMSAGGVRFGTPRLLEHFANPGGLSDPTASPRLVRLSSESVMIAFNGARQGRWVVRAAAIDPHGPGKVDTVSAPGEDALLSDLAAGPDGEALALWMAPQRAPDGRLDTAAQALVAARGVDAFPSTAIFGAAEQFAPAGPNSEASLAFDPASDRALAVWRGAGGSVRYAIRASSAP